MMENTIQSKINKLADIIRDSDNIAFFGGAGVSTESGIPDFRSKDGLYNQHDVQFDMYQPEYLLSHTCLVNNPKVYFEFHRQRVYFTCKAAGGGIGISMKIH
jgi:NAD-dependent deacetylase